MENSVNITSHYNWQGAVPDCVESSLPSDKSLGNRTIAQEDGKGLLEDEALAAENALTKRNR